jgi:parallel beta-helix repeat protein
VKWRGHGLNSSRVVFLVLLSILSLCTINTQPVKPQISEVIYIASNGSVYSSTNVTVPIQRVGDLYVFNGNVIGYSLVVQRDNIVVDGAGHTLQGQGNVGIDLSYRSNVTIKNVQIGGGYFYGIYLWYSLSNVITGNSIGSNMGGIMIENSSNNIISANTVTNNENGIMIYFSSNNTLRNNSMDNNYNFLVYGTELSHFVNDVDVSNTINDKKVYWLINESDRVMEPSIFPDLGCLILVNCQRITVQNLELANNGQGILLAYTTDSTIIENYIHTNSNGIVLFSSSNNRISGNSITKNHRGIQLSKSSKNNAISTNNITNNGEGLYLFESSQNIINENNVTNSQIGIGFRESSDNMIYHNNFISNSRQVYDSHMDVSSVTPSVNFWDFSYPVGGNYWSDYAGSDWKTGANQDHFGSDGIGDTPYIIYENNEDNYPLMPFGSPPAVLIVSPENKTYTVNHVPLTFVVSEPTSWMGYILDGQANVTIAGNTTLSGLSIGSHQLVVYAKDIDEKTGTSETIHFTITQQSEPFPTTWIVAATVMGVLVGATILVYFVKVKKTSGKVEK